MNAQLYKIAAGQMKINPASVKQALEDAYLITKAWKGIILLGEADKLHERRSVYELERNQLVSGTKASPSNLPDLTSLTPLKSVPPILGVFRRNYLPNHQ
jgi:hypothetical protein